MGVIFKNSVMYSGDINQIYNGMNIDYSTILYSNTTTSFQSPLTYTASKDCIVYVAYNGSNSTNMRMLINNQQATPDTLNSRLSYTLILDKNDTIQSRYDAGNAETCYCTMKIYPIIYPTKDILPIIYSEEEQEIGCWVNGKPLYQKTIYLGTITKDTNWHYLPHGIDNIDMVVSCKGIMGEVNNTTFAPMPNYRPGYSMGICIEINQTNIGYMQNWLDSPSDKTYITIQYTKTTDQPGSGSWTPMATPTQHYSTNEQVVGTWIDGSTVYEKTIMSPSVTTGDNTIAHGITNAGRLIQSFGSTYAGTTLNWLNIPNASSNSNYILNIYNFNSTSFNFEVGSSFPTLTDVQITLRYTKST